MLAAPARITDLADCLAHETHVHDLRWQVLNMQIRGGRSWAYRVDGDAVAVGGLYPGAAGEAEAWFCVSPAAAPHTLGIVRQTRLTLAGAPYRCIDVWTYSPAGARLAAMCGFVRDGGRTDGKAEHWTRRA